MTHAEPISTRRPLLSALLLAPFVSGCVEINRWTEGVWVEECLETQSTYDCDWAADLLEPDEPYAYIIGDPTDAAGEDWDMDIDDGLLLSDGLALYDGSTDDLWTYCDGYGDMLRPHCDLPIQLFQPDNGLEDALSELCEDPETTWVWGWSEGLLLREGEAVFNHNIQIECTAQGTDQDPDQDSEWLTCGYSSVLKLQ